MRMLVRGDIDGFFGLALDNLVQLLLIDTLCRHVLGFPDELLHERILPGVAVSLLVGNLYYAWAARRLAAATGRRDVCALPYGINTVSIFGHVFLVMLPAKLGAEAAGLDARGHGHRLPGPVVRRRPMGLVGLHGALQPGLPGPRCVAAGGPPHHRG